MCRDIIKRYLDSFMTAWYGSSASFKWLMNQLCRIPLMDISHIIYVLVQPVHTRESTTNFESTARFRFESNDSQRAQNVAQVWKIGSAIPEIGSIPLLSADFATELKYRWIPRACLRRTRPWSRKIKDMTPSSANRRNGSWDRLD